MQRTNLCVRGSMGHLTLTRRIGEAFLIGDDVRIEIVTAKPGRVQMTISAPRNIPVLREELQDANRRKEPRRTHGRAA